MKGLIMKSHILKSLVNCGIIIYKIKLTILIKKGKKYDNRLKSNER